MFEYLQGTLAQKKPTHAVVDVGGTGYRVEISLSTYDKLPAAGQKARLLTVLKPGDDAWRIFGFADEDERGLFLELVETVGQLGPRKALSILSHATPSELRAAIDAGDADKLRRIKGIGEKLANRIVTELRGKLPKIEAAVSGPQADAAHALVSLGYNRADAEAALRKCGDGSAEELVRKALRHL